MGVPVFPHLPVHDHEITEDLEFLANYLLRGLQPLTPTAQTAAYTAQGNDAVLCTSGTFTVTLPSPLAGTVVDVSNAGTGVITVTTPSGVIRGAGLLAAGSASITLAIPGAGVLLLSDGTDWWIIGGGQTTAWLSVATLGFTNSWVAASQTPSYMKDSAGFVHLRGSIKNGAPNPSAAFTLPAGFRPGQNFLVATVQVGSTPAALTITTAGVVTVSDVGATTNETFLDVVLFLAEN